MNHCKQTLFYKIRYNNLVGSQVSNLFINHGIFMFIVILFFCLTPFCYHFFYTRINESQLYKNYFLDRIDWTIFRGINMNLYNLILLIMVFTGQFANMTNIISKRKHFDNLLHRNKDLHFMYGGNSGRIHFSVIPSKEENGQDMICFTHIERHTASSDSSDSSDSSEGTESECSSEICVHGKNRRYCKDCGGIGICLHNVYKRFCKDCKGSGISDFSELAKQKIDLMDLSEFFSNPSPHGDQF